MKLALQTPYEPERLGDVTLKVERATRSRATRPSDGGP